jgi:apolipoprotein N-acyltransferase
VKLRTGPKAAAVLSLAAGGLAALAFPPFGVLPGVLGYGLLLHLVDTADERRPLRSAFWRGWLAAFAFFLISCWWVAEAFMVDARGQGWMAPFAVALLPSGMGLFWGSAMAAYRAIRPRGWSRILVFASLFTVAEWLRGHVLTGFPWNLPGETWPAGDAVSQAAALVGAYGLTWLTVAGAAAFAPLLAHAGDLRAAWRHWAPPAAVALLGLGAVWTWGSLRLAHPLPADPHAPLVRVVQADVRQETKYSGDSVRSIFQRYLALTAQPGPQAPDIVVWSEGAIPVSANELLEPGGGGAEAIRASLHTGETLLFGAYRYTGDPDRPTYYNSLIAARATPTGLQTTGVYDKHRLVPFGEYLPAEPLLTAIGFKSLAHLGDSYAAGPSPRPISPAGTPEVQPLICYESLFPDLVRKAVGAGPARPRWIVNVSNDSWFGVTSGPIQHLNQASYRAIEEGLPIVRATPTGVSAVIDAYGRIADGDRLGFGRMAVIDARLPPAAAPTPFARFGEAFLVIVLAGSALTLLKGISRQARKLW